MKGDGAPSIEAIGPTPPPPPPPRAMVWTQTHNLRKVKMAFFGVSEMRGSGKVFPCLRLREVLEWPYAVGGAGVTPPAPQTKVTKVGESQSQLRLPPAHPARRTGDARGRIRTKKL